MPQQFRDSEEQHVGKDVVWLLFPFLHFAGRSETPGKLPSGKERWQRATAKTRRYQVLQQTARNPRCQEELFGLTHQEKQAGVSFGTKGRRKLILGKCCVFNYARSYKADPMLTSPEGIS